VARSFAQPVLFRHVAPKWIEKTTKIGLLLLFQSALSALSIGPLTLGSTL